MVTRRNFLLGVGGAGLLSGLGVGLPGCRSGAPARHLPQTLTESTALSICSLCPSHCGLSVRRINEHPISVTGHAIHPINRGGLCARGAALLQLYYDPDRLAGPMRRDPQVIGGWAPVRWQDGIAEVAERLRTIAAAKSGRLALLRGPGRSLGHELMGRLGRAAGARFVVDVEAPGARAAKEAILALHGLPLTPVPDLAGADLLLSLDSALLEAPEHGLRAARAFAELRARGGRVLHVGPRLGVTGAKADTWVPILPGTAGLFALGVAHVLVKEGFVDEGFLAERVAGFVDQGQENIRSWILRAFPTERVAELSGVPREQLASVARALGAAERPVVVGPAGLGCGHSRFDHLAAHTLNILAGAVDTPGGMLLARPPPFRALDLLDEANPEPLAMTVADFTDAILESREVPVDVCIIHGSDPVFEDDAGPRLAEALARIPLVVSTSPVLTDTVESAHLVLPETLWLEQAADAVGVDHRGRPVVSFTEAAAPLRGEGRPAADIALELARATGGAVAKAMPWKDYAAVKRDRIDAIFEARAGDTFHDAHYSTWAQLLEEGGWRSASYRSARALGRKLKQTGGWWDPVYHHREWSRTARAAPNHRLDLRPVGNAPWPDEALERPEGALWLTVVPEAMLSGAYGASMPYLQDLGPALDSHGWVTVVELNRRKASELGIRTGDTVRLSRGELSLLGRARLTETIRPDVVAVHSGGGRIHAGRFARELGVRPQSILPEVASGRAAVTVTLARRTTA